MASRWRWDGRLRVGLEAKSVKHYPKREKKTVVLFSGATVGFKRREDAHLSLCNLADARLSSLEPPGGEKESSEGKARGRGKRNSIDIHRFGRHDAARWTFFELGAGTSPRHLLPTQQGGAGVAGRPLSMAMRFNDQAVGCFAERPRRGFVVKAFASVGACHGRVNGCEALV